MGWFKLNTDTLTSRTFWLAIAYAIFNTAAPELGVADHIITLINALFLSTGAVTIRDAVANVPSPTAVSATLTNHPTQPPNPN
jgi:hypothetical protein